MAKKQSLQLLTIDEVAALLKVDKVTLRRWDKEGRLKAVRVGSRRGIGDRRYRKEDIEKYLKKNKIGKCYLCGRVGEMTEEHVPPKFLSPESSRSEFAFVSACESCNWDSSHEESKLRDFLATAGSGRDVKSADDAYKTMKKSFERNPIGRAGRPHKDLVRIIKSISKKDFYSPSGRIYLGTANIINPPKDLNVEEAMLKIARSLHFLYSGEVIPREYIKHAILIDKIEFPELYKEAKTSGRAGDFFHFRGGWAKQDSKAGIWYMLFYKRIGVMAWFISPDDIKQG